MKRIFRYVLLLALSISLAPAYAGQSEHSERGWVPLPGSTAGQIALQQIQSWYNSTVQNCGTATRPAFLCSGVMIRATVSGSASFFPWDPSPAAIQSGGTSFSWLRTDENFAHLVYENANGYIFYPVLATPAGKDSNIAVYCVFPHDAGSNDRHTLQGCGAAVGYESTSRPCESQGIETAAQWNRHFSAITGNKHWGQCGWSVREGEAGATRRFYESILARQGLDATSWNVQNEIRLATWRTGYGASLPIRAFFYVTNVAGTLALAQSDQNRYYAAYGQVIPIIRLLLPTSKAGKATFGYAAGDQVRL